MALQRGEQRHLLDGDRLVLNLGQSHNFWLAFHDLTSSTAVSVLEEDASDRRAPFALSQRGGPGSSKSSSTAASNRFESTRLRPKPSRSPWQHQKDEDDISTAATPHDLHLEEEAEDEDVGAGRYLLKAGPPSSFSLMHMRGQQSAPEVAPWARARSGTSTVTVCGWRPMGSGSGSEGEISSRPSSQSAAALTGRSGYHPMSSLSPVRRTSNGEGGIGAHGSHRRAMSPGLGRRGDAEARNDKSPVRARAETTVPWRI